MNLYNAGLYTSNFNLQGTVMRKLVHNEQQMRLSNKWYLESYHYIRKGKACKNIRQDQVKIFLDCGAYSAFTLGEVIDMGEYCDFVHANQDIILESGGVKMIAALDVIGNAEESWKNFEEMKRRGVKAIPCFHFNEPWEFLDHYVAEGYEYISLGGLVRSNLFSLEQWFNQVFERTCNPDGTPRIKFHAFGLTALKLMLQYPWYSVDSSTWVQWAANGMILIPTRMGQLDISSKSSRRKVANQHIDSLPAVMTDAIEEEIKRLGGDPDRLRNLYYSRWAWNCWAFPWYARNKHFEGDKFVLSQPTLF